MANNKNNTLITIAIAALAILYFAYNLRETKKSETVDLKKLKPVVEKQVEALGELSPPVVENSFKASSENTQNTTTSKENNNDNDISADELIEVKDVGIDVNNIPEDLPEDLKEQLKNPPPLPDDLKAQLNAPPPPIPPDIEQALKTPPREVSIDEVNSISQ